ncbi:hepatitis A virus cellular receptor 1 isoform X2 [Tamandua tetradactyla]|uniref:hepatitis A virus cellular receptor 1 isoform X2 n=1 Tax=Tamandua tetradactyla TaxID=48850 RepID=UPI004053B80C
MHAQAAISSLIVFLTSAVVSYPRVSRVEGQAVTLPCTYPVVNGDLLTMCWGRGACPPNQCSDALIWTNGSHATFEKHRRYKLKGNLLEGNVSLTIENAAEADGGLYCCRIEYRGWFNDKKITLSLEIKPATSPIPKQPARTQETGRTQPTSSPFHCDPSDGNGTVTQSSDGLWHKNQTGMSLAQAPGMSSAKEISIGVGIFAAVLLSLLVVMFIKRHFYVRNKLQQLSMVSLTGPQIGALQSAAENRVQAEDNIYTIEDNLYVMD